MSPRLKGKAIPPGTGAFKVKPSTWTCRWDGCPDEGRTFTAVGNSLRDQQRHHVVMHGVLPHDPEAAAAARSAQPGRQNPT